MSEERQSQEEEESEEKLEEKPKRRSRKKKTKVAKVESQVKKKASCQVTLIAEQNFKLSSGTFVGKGETCVVKQEYADILLKQTNAFEIAPYQLNN